MRSIIKSFPLATREDATLPAKSEGSRNEASSSAVGGSPVCRARSSLVKKPNPVFISIRGSESRNICTSNDTSVTVPWRAMLTSFARLVMVPACARTVRWIFAEPSRFRKYSSALERSGIPVKQLNHPQGCSPASSRIEKGSLPDPLSLKYQASGTRSNSASTLEPTRSTPNSPSTRVMRVIQ